MGRFPAHAALGPWYPLGMRTVCWTRVALGCGLLAMACVLPVPEAVAQEGVGDVRQERTNGATDNPAAFDDLSKGIGIGDWFFRPSVQLRLRGSFEQNPLDLGGDRPTSTAVLADGYQVSGPPIAGRVDPVKHAWGLSSRARFGLAVEYHQVTGVIELQDARLWGHHPSSPQGLGQFDAHQAYIDIKSDPDRPLFQARLGRQRVHWGSGRLLGDNEWQPRGGAIDAVRMWSRRGGLEVQLLGAMLSPPAALAGRTTVDAPAVSSSADTESSDPDGPGAQLVGLHSRWRPLDAIGIEVTALGRLARSPLPSDLTPSDVAVFDVRLSGEQRGFFYAAEGAYQIGRVASFGENRSVSAYAAAVDLAWQSSLPLSLRLDLTAAYASGDDSGGQGESLTRFDPILPEKHAQPGQMDLLAWSNSLQGSFAASIRPMESLMLKARYVYAGLAETTDRWTTGGMVPIGASADNTDRTLAHEVDIIGRYQPWEALSFFGSYSLAVLGGGGQAIVEASGRGAPDLMHTVFLQSQLSVP